MELNKIYHGDCIQIMKGIPPNSIDLIIADPPYYRTIDEKWDKQWDKEEDYINWTAEWFEECARVLKTSGSFYCYGNFDMLTKIKTLVFDKKLDFRQNITLNKGVKSIAGRTSRKLKMFPTASEHLLFYIHKDRWKYRQIIKNKRLRKGYTIKQMAEKIGVHSSMYGFYEQDNTCPRFPTKEKWASLSEILEINISYEDISQKFNLPKGVTDVWDFTIDKIRFGHKTQKPSEICNRIIKSSSNENDTVLIPFGGSGSECVAAIKLNRNFICIEKEWEYCKIANKRIKELQTSLF